MAAKERGLERNQVLGDDSGRSGVASRQRGCWQIGHELSGLDWDTVRKFELRRGWLFEFVERLTSEFGNLKGLNSSKFDGAAKPTRLHSFKLSKGSEPTRIAQK